MFAFHVGFADTPLGRFAVLASPRGLRRIVLPGGDAERAFAAARPQERGARLLEGGLAAEAAECIGEFYAGRRTSFDELPLDPLGTPFERAVWQEVRRVPFGALVTYGGIASALGKPRAARAVGRANGANPLPLVVPCHRVVGAGGRLVGFGGGLALKERMLRFEGFEIEGGATARARVRGRGAERGSHPLPQGSTSPSRIA